MDKKEAYEALLEGKKIRHKKWGSDEYIYFDKENLNLVGEDGTQYLSFSELKFNCEWEYYQKRVSFCEAIKNRGIYSNGKNKYEIEEKTVYELGCSSEQDLATICEFARNDEKIWLKLG
jgi:hypothetical protein